jgi:hypothetical protein
MKALLLIVTVLSSGGPPAAGSLPLTGARVIITRGTSRDRVAEAADGRLSVRLRPGVYAVVALLQDEPLRPPNFCEAAAIAVPRKPQTKPLRLKLYCSIK